jgi:hypothetical protein
MGIVALGEIQGDLKNKVFLGGVVMKFDVD